MTYILDRHRVWISIAVIVCLLAAAVTIGGATSANAEGASLDPASPLVLQECDYTMQEGLLYCDDYEQDKMSEYYDFHSRWGRWSREFGKGIGGSWGLGSYYGFYAGDKTDGVSTPPHGTWINLAVGATPDNSSYKPAGDPETAERELFVRFYVKNHTVAEGEHTASTGTLVNVSGIGPGGAPFMEVDVSYPDQSGVLVSELRTADFEGSGNGTPTGMSVSSVLTGTSPVMHKDEAGAWHEIQLRVKLNDAGQSNGIYELWVDGQLESSAYNVDYVGSYAAYGINSIQLYNTNNQPGVPGGDLEYRAYDNLMVARQAITPPGVISPDNASLKALGVDNAKLSPAFRSTQLSYQALLHHGEKKIHFAPETADEQATIRVNGKKHNANKPIFINMKSPHRTIEIEVTARDGIHKKTYTIEGVYPNYAVNECASPDADWLFCDDFELDRSDSYFEHMNPDQFYRTGTVGLNGSSGMKAEFRAADGEQYDTGAIKLAFGRTPHAYMDPVAAAGEDLREVYFRFYVKHEEGWEGGGGDKMARLTSMQSPNWAQTAIAHVWSGSPNNDGKYYMVAEAVSGTDAAGVLKSTGWNDFPNHRYMGGTVSKTPVFDSEHVGEWYSVEARVKLNDPGQSNGIFQIWIDDVLEMNRTNVNWIGSYAIGPEAGYGFNWFALENYWNAGTPKDQERYFDNLVISRSKIGPALQP